MAYITELFIRRSCSSVVLQTCLLREPYNPLAEIAGFESCRLLLLNSQAVRLQLLCLPCLALHCLDLLMTIIGLNRQWYTQRAV